MLARAVLACTVVSSLGLGACSSAHQTTAPKGRVPELRLGSGVAQFLSPGRIQLGRDTGGAVRIGGTMLVGNRPDLNRADTCALPAMPMAAGTQLVTGLPSPR